MISGTEKLKFRDFIVCVWRVVVVRVKQTFISFSLKHEKEEKKKKK